MVRYGRQTVSVDVDVGVVLFDRKAASFGVERVSHDRSKDILYIFSSAYNCSLARRCIVLLSSGL